MQNARVCMCSAMRKRVIFHSAGAERLKSRGFFRSDFSGWLEHFNGSVSRGTVWVLCGNCLWV